MRPSALIESLESRRMLAGAVVDLRLPGGGTGPVTINSVGQMVDFEVWVTVTGDDADISNDGLQTVVGSLLSFNVGGGAALGTINTGLLAPFNGNSSSTGAFSDLDLDGDLDVGSANPASPNGYFFARANAMTTDGTNDVPKGQAFKIATAVFTVTQLLEGVSTDLEFFPRPGEVGALFRADGKDIRSEADPNIKYESGSTIIMKRPGAATIQGRVFNDKNANGIFDGADEGIGGFRVFLDEDFDGILDEGELSKPVSSTGTYKFTGVDADVYRVREVARPGWRQTFPALGYIEVVLPYGTVAKSQSFANTDTVLIKGNVFMDANKNGKKDALESGMGGWMLYIDHNKSGVLDKGDDWTLSDSKGNYRFFNLPANTYVVRIVAQPKYVQTAPGGTGAHTITLGAGGTVSNKNFGEKRLK